MSDIVSKLRLKEMAEEDIYFAKQDIELIEALHKKKLVRLAKCNGGEKRRAKDFEKRFKSLTEKNKRKPRKRLHAIRALLDEIQAACRRRR
ncbi:MAG: hypothetical protein LJE70_03795 [Chromatiaceae bacterium]|nr:hypothetical protein [Chromatiaceae bacterium]